jgi:hypothetical protein
MAVPGADKEQPRTCENRTVQRSKSRTSDEQRHQPGKHSKHFVTESDGDGEGSLNVVGRENGEVSDVGADVDDGDDGDADTNGTREVPKTRNVEVLSNCHQFQLTCRDS